MRVLERRRGPRRGGPVRACWQRVATAAAPGNHATVALEQRAEAVRDRGEAAEGAGAVDSCKNKLELVVAERGEQEGRGSRHICNTELSAQRSRRQSGAGEPAVFLKAYFGSWAAALKP